MDRPKPSRPPWTQLWVPVAVPVPLLLSIPCGSVLSTVLLLYLHLHWPDTLAPVDLAELGKDRVPKKWGCMLGPDLWPTPKGAKTISK